MFMLFYHNPPGRERGIAAWLRLPMPIDSGWATRYSSGYEGSLITSGVLQTVASVPFQEARSEPKAEATQIEEIVPGIWHWFVWDNRIGAESHAHAVSGEGGAC